MSLITLRSIYLSFDSIQHDLNKIVYSGVILLLLFLMAFLGGLMWLKFEDINERKKFERKMFFNSESQVYAAHVSRVEEQIQEEQAENVFVDDWTMPLFYREGTDAFNEAVIRRYHQLHDNDLYTKTRLCKEIYGGKKSNHYQDKLAAILALYGEEL